MSSKINICIVGVGLIGGSLGWALRKKNRKKYFVTGLGRDPKKLRAAKRLGAIDRFDTNPARALEFADIVVLCVPVHRIVPQLAKIARWLKKGAIVTDVGSVKKNVIDGARRVLSGRPDVRFVGAHPIAGSEKTGVENATAMLFENAVCVLTTDGTNGSHGTYLKRIRQMWRDAGARCVTLRAADHDRFLALTSHLPHVLAFALFQCVSQAARKNPIIKSLVAGSFRDMTRIAGSDPQLWAGVIETNRREIQKMIRGACAQLVNLGRAPLSKLTPALRQLQHAKEKWPTLR